MLTTYCKYNEALDWIIEKAKAKSSVSVCIANVHMCMETYDNSEYAQTVNNADLATPDGKPLIWVLKLLGYKNCEQIRGTDLFHSLCQAAPANKLTIGLYGSTESTLNLLKTKLNQLYPQLEIAYTYSPPFRALNPEESAKIGEEINNSGCNILFVGLGCPKQEIWMSQNRGKVNSVMIGVGAAFDFISGQKKEAPLIFRKIGLEWFYRLCSEPRRLFVRYFKHNPRFIYLAIKQILFKL